jgi:hypothetical protein
MKRFTTTPPTIGMDVGDRWRHCGILDASGEVVEEGRRSYIPEKKLC